MEIVRRKSALHFIAERSEAIAERVSRLRARGTFGHGAKSTQKRRPGEGISIPPPLGTPPSKRPKEDTAAAVSSSGLYLSGWCMTAMSAPHPAGCSCPSSGTFGATFPPVGGRLWRTDCRVGPAGILAMTGGFGRSSCKTDAKSFAFSLVSGSEAVAAQVVGRDCTSRAAAYTPRLARSVLPPLPTANASLVCGGSPARIAFEATSTTVPVIAWQAPR